MWLRPGPALYGLAPAGAPARSRASLPFVAYVTLLVLARPLHMRWGSTGDELRGPLPGDELARSRLQGAARRYHPGAAGGDLALAGADRHGSGGFYRAICDWRTVSGSTSATPAGYIWSGRVLPPVTRCSRLHGDYLRMGRWFGWRVSRAERNRGLVLENWGCVRPGARRLRDHAPDRANAR